MTLTFNHGTIPGGWLAFELSVLRRLKFRSVAIPFTGEAELGLYLKRWNISVATSDESRWSYMRALALIENNTERLTEGDVETVLEDAYVPGYKLNNPSMSKWFTETDAWWFDNVREKAEQLETPVKRALALTVAMMVGDYARSFNEETRRFRQPLSTVYRRVWQKLPEPVNNSKRNTSANRHAREFVAEQHTDLLFLRLPNGTHERGQQPRHQPTAWREEWLRGSDDFWDEFEKRRVGRLGVPVETRQQYLHLVEDLLETALHLPKWAIAHVENGFISTADLVDSIAQVRKVETIYTKDFSELTGIRASIITA
jgi:hypothetical protein